MLQQTRVETVKRYYVRWLERFPDLESLAEADEDQVLKAWEGLGYYRRARDLRHAARVVRETSGGVLPSASSGLRALPGVGEYTAGAVASIAFGEVAPAVDGNVRRVLSRLYDAPDPKARWLREAARALVDPQRPGDWNQAVMELGATICTPRTPRCDACPIAEWCQALAAGTQRDRPGVREKRNVPTVTFAVGVFHTEGRVLFVKRPPEGLLAGMWAFPERQFAGSELHDAGPGSEGSVVGLATELGLGVTGAREPLPRREHRFTHVRAVYVPWAVGVVGATETVGRAWVSPVEANELPLPVAQRRVLESWKAMSTSEAH